MDDRLSKTIYADMSTIPVSELRGSSDRERVMKLLAHMFLRLWTRVSLETSYRPKLSPSQFSLGSYEGNMRWVLSSSFDFATLPEIELEVSLKREHSLLGEIYRVRNDERVRLAFSLEEEKVKAQPVMVNYLVYDESLKGFDVMAAVSALMPALRPWIATISGHDEGPLWNYCKGNLECVGI